MTKEKTRRILDTLDKEYGITKEGFAGLFPTAQPILLEMRNTWVSTVTPGIP